MFIPSHNMYLHTAMQTEDFNEVFMDEMGVKPLLECLYSHVCAYNSMKYSD